MKKYACYIMNPYDRTNDLIMEIAVNLSISRRKARSYLNESPAEIAPLSYEKADRLMGALVDDGWIAFKAENDV